MGCVHSVEAKDRSTSVDAFLASKKNDLTVLGERILIISKGSRRDGLAYTFILPTKDGGPKLQPFPKLLFKHLSTEANLQILEFDIDTQRKRIQAKIEAVSERQQEFLRARTAVNKARSLKRQDAKEKLAEAEASKIKNMKEHQADTEDLANIRHLVFICNRIDLNKARSRQRQHVKNKVRDAEEARIKEMRKNQLEMQSLAQDRRDDALRATGTRAAASWTKRDVKKEGIEMWEERRDRWCEDLEIRMVKAEIQRSQFLNFIISLARKPRRILYQIYVRSRIPVLNKPYIIGALQQKYEEANSRRLRYILLKRQLPAAVHLRNVYKICKKHKHVCDTHTPSSPDTETAGTEVVYPRYDSNRYGNHTHHIRQNTKTRNRAIKFADDCGDNLENIRYFW